MEAASGRIIYRIREQVLRFIEQEFPPDPDEFFLESFSNFEKAEEPDPERSVYRDMIRVEQKKKEHSDGWILLNLAGKDGSGRLENVKAFCREKKMGLILLDGSSLLELGREKFRSMFGELGVNALLKERVIAVTWEDALGERELFRVLREMGHEWDRLPVLVIIITETPLRPVIPGSAHVPAVFEIREPDPFARKDMGMRYAKKWQIPFEDGFGEMWQRFRFTPGQFQNVLEQAAGRVPFSWESSIDPSTVCLGGSGSSGDVEEAPSGHLQPKQKSGAGIWYLGIFKQISIWSWDIHSIYRQPGDRKNDGGSGHGK